MKGEKEKTFKLVSNFSGSKYNLYDGDNLMNTIDFATGICGKFPVRSFNIFYLGNEITSSGLFKKEGEELDLSVLFEHPENQGLISKLSNEMPAEDPSGNFVMNFGRKNILPAVENAVILDTQGEEQMEMVKTNDGTFEVNYSDLISR